MSRAFLLLSTIAFAACMSGQSELIGKKNLLISLGGGAACGSTISDLPAYGATGAAGGQATFGFGYAFNANWGMGIRFDRIGFVSAFDTLAQARATLWQLHGTYRPWQTAVQALEVETGIGGCTLSFRGRYQRIPAEASSYSLTVGVRYLHSVHRSILAFCALRATTTGPGTLEQGEVGMLAPDGTQAEVAWRGIALNVGLAVRW